MWGNYILIFERDHDVRVKKLASRTIPDCCLENSANDRDTIALEAIILPQDEKEKILCLRSCSGSVCGSAGL